MATNAVVGKVCVACPAASTTTGSLVPGIDLTFSNKASRPGSVASRLNAEDAFSNVFSSDRE